MRRSDLGEFEELVLLAVFTPEAYSVVIAEEIPGDIFQTAKSKARKFSS